MASVLRNLRSVLVGPPHPGAVYECRHCGTAVESATAACPACGGEEIARYDL